MDSGRDSGDSGYIGDQARIVVGVDGTEGSKAALRWAVHEAELAGCGVLAVNACQAASIGWAPYPSTASINVPIEAEKVLQETVDEVVGPDRTIDVALRVVRGAAGRVLVRTSCGAVLLVVGKRGRHAWTGRLGSVSEYCARHAQCPLAIVRR